MRTIESPGVEIREVDMSFNTELPYGTTSLVVGYAKQGPTDELLNVTSLDELERIYGLPENAAERYMYDTSKQVLNANGNLIVTRIPYGDGDGDGFGNRYSALIYPYIPVTKNNDRIEEYGDIRKEVISFTFPTSSPSLTGASTQGDILTSNDIISFISMEKAEIEFEGVVRNVTKGVSNNIILNFSSGGVVNGSTHSVLSSVPELSAGVWTADISFTKTDSPKYHYEEAFTFTLRATHPEDDIVFENGDVQISSVSGIKLGDIAAVSIDQTSDFYLGEPIHVSIDDDTYFKWQQGGINWKNGIDSGVMGLSLSGDDMLDHVGYGAMIIVNEAKTTIDGKFEGFYVAVADNSKTDKSMNFNSIVGAKSFNSKTASNEWVCLNANSLAFDLTGSHSKQYGSVSEIVESVPDFDFSDAGKDGYSDSIILTLFKLRPSLYSQETRVLDSVLYEAYVGSFDSTRKVQNPNGGSHVNFYLEDVVNGNSKNLKVFINPNISKKNGSWYDSNTGDPVKHVRIKSDEKEGDDNAILSSEPAGTSKILLEHINTKFGSFLNDGDNLYSVGVAESCEFGSLKYIGNLPSKLEKALRLAEDYERLRIDLVPEGGLGTIWVGAKLGSGSGDGRGLLFDDTQFIEGILGDGVDDKRLSSQENGEGSEVANLYQTIANIFNQFCEFTRKDCLQICDPLRYIFIQGEGNVKVLDDKTRNFSQHIYWPLKNLFGALNTSYACTYANWFKVNDNASDRFVWTPPSGYIANLMIKTDVSFYPWYAPAGLTRGLQSGVLDIAINPTAKQRDLLYKIGINPTVYWPGDGYVVWGQKTLQSKPSVFDRINVRRLFLWAEKAVLPIARYFVFEQNTPFTRNRLRSAIDPVLAFARSNEGLYDYLIVCDERNNTSDTIDRNELIVDIYLKATRVSEFVLINFVATRTSQSFEELI